MNRRDTKYMASCFPSLRPSDDTTEFSLFFEGDELYEAMLKSIENAEYTVWLEAYIFAKDEIGTRFINAMIDQARRGLDVRLHIDAAGSFGQLSQPMKLFLRNNGVKLAYFHRWSWRKPWRYNQRNHRKLLVVDNKVAFLGGFNIHRDSSLECVGEQRWRDTHVQIQGEIAKDAAWLFELQWHGRLHKTPFQCRANDALITNTNRHCRKALHCLLQHFFESAETSLYITTPYYVPDYKTQRALITAALRGVDTRLLVPSKSDVTITRWAAQASYAGLLASGVRIFEYQPRMLHAKTIVADNEWSTVGTANMDYRSFFLNYEINLVSRNHYLALALSDQFQRDEQEAVEVHQNVWLDRHWHEPFFEVVGWLMRRWL